MTRFWASKKKWSLPWLPTLQQNFQSYNGMATYYPRNWKSTLKYFTVLHHCKTIFKKFEIFTGAILSLFSFLSARQYCVIKKLRATIFMVFDCFIPEWNNGLDRRANIIHWIWFWLYRWERLLHSKCLPRVMRHPHAFFFSDLRFLSGLNFEFSEKKYRL